MPSDLLAGTVQGSKAKRQERLKSRFRDRGGIFVPSDENALVDILLARGVNGESPVKRRTPGKKSTRTPKRRPSAPSRTGTSKRAPRKSAAIPSEGDENYPPSKKRRDALKHVNLQHDKRTPSMDTGITAGPSRPHAAAQRKPFANQLADAINSIKTDTAPDSRLKAVKDDAVPAIPGTPPLLWKSDKAFGGRKAEGTAACYSAGLERFGGEPAHPIKSPLFLTLERQQLEKQAQKRAGGVALQESEPANNLRTKEVVLDGSDSDDSDVPLAKKYAGAAAGSRTRLKKGKENLQPPSTKRRPKAKAPGREAQDVDTGMVLVHPAGRRRKVAKDAADPPPPPKTQAGADSGGRGGRRKARVLQEKSVPANAPHKRKERIKPAVLDATEHEHEHEPPKKKRRRAEHAASRGGKKNKEMSRSAREAATVRMDKPLPSPVKQPAGGPKRASKAKGPRAPRSRSCGLPQDVLRRVRAIAQARPVLDDIDDDDPIDFLRS